MKRTLIRYKTKPEMADKNAELVAGVFAELKATKPDGVRYASRASTGASGARVPEKSGR